MPRSPTSAELAARFRARDATVGIIGLGYVGLPLVRAMAAAGFRVIGFDTDGLKIEMLERGETYIRHLPGRQFRELIAEGRFSATNEFSKVGQADAIVICVPTPLTPHREPDLDFVIGTGKTIAPFLRVGQLIVLESTTYPGTSREVLKPLLARSGLEFGRDIFLAFSPEREDPGNSEFSLTSVPKIVGGDDRDALELAIALYDQVVGKTVPVSSLDTAEAVKITENIFRAVNIALVNELKLIFTCMGIDVWEVIEAAKTKPFGFMAFYPGPGLGGHCIPIDPFYLTWKAREYEMPTRFIELAGEINASMPALIVNRTIEELGTRFSKSLTGSRVLLLGLAYKRNVEDIRESPSLRIIELLERRGAHVDYHDPYVAEIPPTRQHGELAGRRSVELRPESIRDYDLALIVTDHDSVDYGVIVDNAKLVIDTRNAVSRVAGRTSPNVCKA
jgi:UDP-N-acetyl-D-glucosamine dehydrogenase